MDKVDDGSKESADAWATASSELSGDVTKKLVLKDKDATLVVVLLSSSGNGTKTTGELEESVSMLVSMSMVLSESLVSMVVSTVVPTPSLVALLSPTEEESSEESSEESLDESVEPVLEIVVESDVAVVVLVSVVVAPTSPPKATAAMFGPPPVAQEIHRNAVKNTRKPFFI
jgi:hypothetical protein